MAKSEDVTNCIIHAKKKSLNAIGSRSFFCYYFATQIFNRKKKQLNNAPHVALLSLEKLQ
jgi:hypothetical protein